MRRSIKFVLPVLVIIVGVLVAIMLFKTRPKAKREVVERILPRVEVAKVKRAAGPARVEAMGTVIAARRITLHAEVTGRVVWQSSKLMPGGRFRKGEVIARLDARDYRLQRAQQEAALQRARVALDLERGRGRVARREWRDFKRDGLTNASGELAQRDPQLRAAKSDVAAARSALAKAQLDISRTTLRAPFNAVVTTEAVDVGQLVTPQMSLATLVGTDAFRVQVSLPLGKLPWVRLPEGKKAGSTALVVAAAAGRADSSRRGEVVRLQSELEPKGRLARLLVSVDNPLDGEGTPLLLGTYVRVMLQGNPLTRTYAIPRMALQQDDSVMVVGARGHLTKRKVQVAWRQRDTIFLSANRGTTLRPGVRVLVGRLAGARDGMRVLPSLVGGDSEATKVGANVDQSSNPSS